MEPVLQGSGSGFIIDSRGYILTAAHVVDHVDKIVVKRRSDDRYRTDDVYNATVVAMDREHDLALLKIKARKLPTIALGVASEVRRKENVWAFGFPENRVTETYPSKARGQIESISGPDRLREFKTSVLVSPGNSGGPLVNGRGEAIGVVVSIASKVMFQYGKVKEQTNLSAVVPISVARVMLPENVDIDDKPSAPGLVLSEEEIEQSVVPSVVLVLWKAVGSQVARRQANVYHQQGLKALLNSHFRNAIEEFNKAIAADHTHVNAYKGRGQAHFFQGNAELAVVDFGVALSLSPKDGDAYAGRSNANYHAGYLDDALNDINAAIAINGNDASAYLLRGQIYGRQGEPDRALNDYDRAIAVNPTNPSAYEKRGLLHLNHFGRTQQACADWAQACALAVCKYYASAVLAERCDPLGP